MVAGHCLKNVPCKVKRTGASFLARLAGVNVNNRVKLLCFNAVLSDSVQHVSNSQDNMFSFCPQWAGQEHGNLEGQ